MRGRIAELNRERISPIAAIPQIGQAVPIVDPKRVTKISSPCRTETWLPYWLAYIIVQNQNLSNTPHPHNVKAVTKQGRLALKTNRAVRQTLLRIGTFARQSPANKYNAPNKAKRTAGCFIKIASPNRKPLAAVKAADCRSAGLSRASMPAATNSTTKCVACAAVPSTFGIKDRTE